MSAELPVVTSDLPVFREYLVAGRDALMAPVGDVPALADALHAVATDAALRARPRRRRPADRRAIQLAGVRRGASRRLRAAAACVRARESPSAQQGSNVDEQHGPAPAGRRCAAVRPAGLRWSLMQLLSDMILLYGE